MERRDFIKKSVLISGTFLIGTTLLNSCKKKPQESINFTLDLSDSANASLNTVGGFIQHDKVIVIRTGSTTFAALSNVCTHNGCTVSYYSTSNTLICPCHGGTYSINGGVISGPPPASLSVYKTSLNGSILTITS